MSRPRRVTPGEATAAFGSLLALAEAGRPYISTRFLTPGPAKIPHKSLVEDLS